MNIKTTLQLIGLITLAVSSPVYAGHGDMEEHTHTQEQLPTPAKISDIKPNQVVMEVHGIVCSFCSRGVKKKLAKFNFIDRTLLNEGILMDVKNQRITVAIIKGQVADVPSMFAAVLSGGYEPIQAFVANEKGKIHTVEAKQR